MPTRDVALALLVALLWGCNFVVMKHAVTEIPPFALTGLRFTLAALPAIFFVAKPDVSWRLILAFGLAFGVVKFSLLFTAFKVGMPAGLASLVLQLQAAFTIAVAVVVLGERPTRTQTIGLAIALGGVGLVLTDVAGGATWLPVLLTLSAALAWSGANLIVKRFGRVNMLGLAVWTSLMPGPVMLLASAVFEGPSAAIDAIRTLSPLGWGTLLYLAWPVSLLSGAIWAGLLNRHSAATVTPFALLVPPIGFLSGWLVYGERIGLMTMTGAALILAGLAFGTLRHAQPARDLTSLARGG